MFRKALTKGKAVCHILPCLHPSMAGEGRGDWGAEGSRRKLDRMCSERCQELCTARFAEVRGEVKGHRCVVWLKAESKQNKVLNVC